MKKIIFPTHDFSLPFMHYERSFEFMENGVTSVVELLIINYVYSLDRQDCLENVLRLVETEYRAKMFVNHMKPSNFETSLSALEILIKEISEDVLPKLSHLKDSLHFIAMPELRPIDKSWIGNDLCLTIA